MQLIRSPKTYDVCIIGSGAGGGMAAKILTEGGLNVVMLEAGPQVYPKKTFPGRPGPLPLPPPTPPCADPPKKGFCKNLTIFSFPPLFPFFPNPLTAPPPSPYCGQGGRGSPPASNFSSSQVLLPPAMA